ncbi:MAG: hypothetical protein U1E89_22005 [Burkholderiaceae bacterium]
MSHTPSNPIARPHAAVALALGLMLAGMAHADCVDGVRATTAAELEFNAKAWAALVALLPAAPPNTAMRGAAPDASKPERTPSFCRGEREGAFEVVVGKGYLFTWPRADADRMSNERKQLLEQVRVLETLPPDQAARYDALVQQSRDAYKDQPRAKRGGPPLSSADQQLSDRKGAEAKALYDQAQAILNAHLASVAPEASALRAKADALQTYPQELGVQLRLNASRPDATVDPKRVQLHIHGEPHKGGLVVHNVTVAVGGPEGGARQRLWEALDHARIKALVGAPLPGVADSAARAAANLAAASPAQAGAASPASTQPPTPSSTAAQAAATPPAAPRPTAPAADARPGSAAPTPAASRQDEAARPADAPALAKDAVNTVNKLKGLLGR